ncbi:MAG TPA: bifunctional [glutamate--ammonia ligase]-adenylyl-L-tyrosine phosphorylase/[glutamate--ammonia-ligase] adenylyltransferase [Candidatus Limnocylindria bacterium]|nr:bifunctional [glutamate--ammonia ligase]-adenylyl-L-tyrosine phosphorylase/[glutamate--ammonia-ligase] adenylyltransferase [Candidatus Limnocylindria bacterium]
MAAAAPLGEWLDAVDPARLAAALGETADPVAALTNLARVLDAARVPPPPELPQLLRVLGGSQSLATALASEGTAWPALFAVTLALGTRPLAEHVAMLTAGEEPADRAALQRQLRLHCRRELVRIGGRDLIGLATVDDTVRELSVLAEALVDVAILLSRRRLEREWGAPLDGPFAALGMGKLGGEELNYSSDIDLVYVYGTDGEHPSGRTNRECAARLAEEVTRAISEVTADGVCFRVDLRLRPGGREGPLATSLMATVSYYESWGQTWERAAWLKARPVGGDRDLAAALTAELEPFVYRRYLDFATLEDLKEMKRKVDASLGEAERQGRDVKLGRGGIREIEFWVQAHQLIHAGKDARLRVRSTMAALDVLAQAGYVPAAQAAELGQAYRFLRDVEHKIQIVRQRQTQRLPVDAGERLTLARRLGYRGPEAVAEFEAALARHTAAVHASFERLFYGAEEAPRPGVERLLDHADDPATAAELAQLGFADPETARSNLVLLRDGPPHAPASPRRRKTLAQLAPSLLAEIAESGAPDRALAHMATFITTVGARSSYLHLLLENPGVRRLLLRLFATSEFLSRYFLRHPELLDSLVRVDLVRLVRSPEELAAELSDRLAAAPDLEAQLDGIRRFRHEEFLRIGIHDIEGELDAIEVERQLTALARVCLAAAVDLGREQVVRRYGIPSAAPVGELAVVGMGKLGADELNYHSDLDLVFVYDAGDPAAWGEHDAHVVFTRIAQRTISALATPTTEGIAYQIDTRLRPSGNQGSLVTSLAGFEAYHRSSAAVWERQALVKARVVVGPPALAVRLQAAIDTAAYARGLSPEEAEEVGRIRERMAQERGDDGDIKTGAGGVVDVEFAVQLMQLAYGHREPRLRTPQTRAALDALAETGLLPAADVAALAAGYAFLRALESRLRIERDQPPGSLDGDRAALLALARRMRLEGPDDAVVAQLQEEHAAHRQAVRAAYLRVLERLSARGPR